MQTPTTDATLSVSIHQVREARGVVRVALFNQETGFPDDKAIYRSWVLPVDAVGPLSLEVSDLPPGRYALAVYHDLNNNGKMAKNMWGIPQEPFGFSLNRPAKWRPTRFEEAAFQLTGTQEISVNLSYWDEL